MSNHYEGTEGLKQNASDASVQLSDLGDTAKSAISNLKLSGNEAFQDLKHGSQDVATDIKTRSVATLQPYTQRASRVARNVWSRYVAFTRANPVVASFLTCQALFLTGPLLLAAGFMLFATLTVAFFAASTLAIVAFLVACVLVPTLVVLSFIATTVFLTLGTGALALGWINAVRMHGLQKGTKTFLFGVDRHVKAKADTGGAYALKVEEKVASQTRDAKLDDFIPQNAISAA